MFLFQHQNSSHWLEVPLFSNNTLQAVVRNQLTLKWMFALKESQNTLGCQRCWTLMKKSMWSHHERKQSESTNWLKPWQNFQVCLQFGALTTIKVQFFDLWDSHKVKLLVSLCFINIKSIVYPFCLVVPVFVFVQVTLRWPVFCLPKSCRIITRSKNVQITELQQSRKGVCSRSEMLIIQGLKISIRAHSVMYIHIKPIM